VAENGSDTKTFWPSKEKLALNKHCTGKETERTSKGATYKVVFTDEDGEKYDFEPKTDSEFKQFSIGSQHKILVSVARGVEIVRETK